MYNYEEAVKDDIREWIYNNVEWQKYNDAKALWADLVGDAVMMENVCGGYYYETEEEAKKALAGNEELGDMAARDFAGTVTGARDLDHLIRWMMYGKALEEVCGEVLG